MVISQRRERILSMQAIFQLPFHSQEEGVDLDSIYHWLEDQPAPANEDFASFSNHRKEIDQVTDSTLVDQDARRLTKVDLVTIRPANYETFHCPEIPTEVSTNEAVELVKKFPTSDSSRFINETSGSVVKKHEDRTENKGYQQIQSMEALPFTGVFVKTVQVRELTSYIKRTIDTDYFFSDILVEGEPSSIKAYQSGHTYSNLKDDRVSLSCILSRWERENGMFSLKERGRVLVRGGLSIYEKKTRLSPYVKSMTSKDLGPLCQKFLKTKGELEKEGLFDQEHKQKIPSFVRTLGVVTSGDRAVLRNIIHVPKRKNPGVSLALYPS